jgi:selenide,water dikinase
LLPGVAGLAARGFVTGASERNWIGYGEQVDLSSGLSREDRALLSDPQTSGGLLVACAPQTVEAVLSVFARHGFDSAAVVGRVQGALPGERPRLLVSQ